MNQLAFETNLGTASHYYDSGKYDEAIELLYTTKGQFNVLADKKSLAEVDILMGKCFFRKQEPRTYAYRPMTTAMAKGGLPITLKERVQHGTVIKRMSKKARECFESALHYHPESDVAYHWKGKTLKYDGRNDEAYECFIQAAKLSFAVCYLNDCSDLFSRDESLPFKEIRSFDSKNMDFILDQCSSIHAFERMEACHNVLNRIHQIEENEKNQVKEVISPLAGKTVFCIPIPFTGDSDPRVREAARTVLSRLGSDSYF